MISMVPYIVNGTQSPLCFKKMFREQKALHFLLLIRSGKVFPGWERLADLLTDDEEEEQIL